MNETYRKCRLPSLDADAWSGCVTKTDACVEKTITQVKRNKTKEHFSQLRSQATTRKKMLTYSHKFLEQSKGYLNHVVTFFYFNFTLFQGLSHYNTQLERR